MKILLESKLKPVSIIVHSLKVIYDDDKVQDVLNALREKGIDADAYEMDVT